MVNQANSQEILKELDLNSKEVKAIKSSWQRAHYRAAINWITRYEYSTNSTDLDQVRNFLEAFYHLCEVEDYERARKIYLVETQLPLISNKLYKILEIWGYYNILIYDFNKLIGRLDPDLDIFLSNVLGNSYLSIGKAGIALQYYEVAIRSLEKSNSFEMEGSILVGIGNCYNFLGDYERAHSYYMDGLLSASRTENDQVIQQARGGLGSIHTAIGQYKIALTEYKGQLKIIRKLGDRLAESDSLSSLADVYSYLGENSLALETQEESLFIASKVNYKKGKAKALNQIGILHLDSNKINRARDCFSQSITISREIMFLLGEAEALTNLGIAYMDEDENGFALNILEEALVKFQRINNVVGEGKVLFALARLYHKTGDRTSAFNFCKLAEKLAEQHNLSLLLEIVRKFEENLERDELFKRFNYLMNQIAEKNSLIESQQKLIQSYRESKN